jgi:hypothetical protein
MALMWYRDVMTTFQQILILLPNGCASCKSAMRMGKKSPMLVLLMGMAALGGCDAQKSNNNAVWDDYDIRTPLPYDSSVSTTAAERLRSYDPYATSPYVDNDAYYVPPRIQCGIRDLPACGE